MGEGYELDSDEEDVLRAARGIIFGCILSVTSIGVIAAIITTILMLT